jgi:hypothetical protein
LRPAGAAAFFTYNLSLTAHDAIQVVWLKQRKVWMLHLVASVAHRDESRDKDARTTQSLIAPGNTDRCVPVRLRAYQPIVMMLDQDVRRAAQLRGSLARYRMIPRSSVSRDPALSALLQMKTK